MHVIPITTQAVMQSGQRHLTYSFEIGVSGITSENTSSALSIDGSIDAARNRTVERGGVHDAQSSTGSTLSQNLKTHGTTSYTDAGSDKGQILIDVVGIQPDGALILTVREQADHRGNTPVECAVYQTTYVKCAGPVNPEEFAVLRTLSPKFLEPAYAEPGRTWHIDRGTQDVPSDFKVESKADATIVVDEQRSSKLSGTSRGVTTTQARYSYDQNRLLPTSIAEYTVIHYERDADHTKDTTININARLINDSASNSR